MKKKTKAKTKKKNEVEKREELAEEEEIHSFSKYLILVRCGDQLLVEIE